jgi:hypothetical protein
LCGNTNQPVVKAVSATPYLQMKKIATVVQYDSYLGDRLFQGAGAIQGANAQDTHWLEPYAYLQREGAKQGFDLHTEDIVSPSEADIIFYLDRPRSRRKIQEIRSRNPGARHVVLLLESPLHNACMFEEGNLADFDAVLTFLPSLMGRPGRFRYSLPFSNSKRVEEGPPYDRRKVAVLVSSNINYNLRYIMGILRRNRREGWGGMGRSAWRMVRFNELYSARQQVARAFAHIRPDALDIFGRGWEGEVCSQGVLNGPKLDLIAGYRFNICFENVRGQFGYVSEKLFDGVFAGAVPVYLGDEDIARSVPDEVYVDAREFEGQWDRLARYLISFPEERWRRHHEAGREFIRNFSHSDYSPESFAGKVIKAFRTLV